MNPADLKYSNMPRRRMWRAPQELLLRPEGPMHSLSCARWAVGHTGRGAGPRSLASLRKERLLEEEGLQKPSDKRAKASQVIIEGLFEHF